MKEFSFEEISTLEGLVEKEIRWWLKIANPEKLATPEENIESLSFYINNIRKLHLVLRKLHCYFTRVERLEYEDRQYEERKRRLLVNSKTHRRKKDK